MKKLLLSMFLAINTVPVSHLVYQQISNNWLVEDSFNILATKKYDMNDEESLSVGFEDIIKYDNNIYTSDIIGGKDINIYQIVNNQLKQLVSYSSKNILQYGFLHGYAIDNKVYYEVFIKSNQDDVHLAQYFVLDLNDLTFTNLGIHRVAPDGARFIFRRNDDKIYHFQNYLIFLHSSKWYVNSSSTIINLTNNQVITKNSNSGISMAFDNGLLYYWTDKGVTANDIRTNTNYYLTDTLNQQLGTIYAFNNQAFVSGIDKDTNINYINRIKLINNNLVLEKLSIIETEVSINQVFYLNNTLYFVGTDYDVNTNIESVYLYQYQNNKLQLLTEYDFENGLSETLFYSFHNNYFEVTSNNQIEFVAIRYDLNSKKEIRKTFESYQLNNVKTFENETFFALSNIDDLFINTYIVNLDWTK